MALTIKHASGFAYFWAPDGCVGYAQLQGETITSLTVSPGRVHVEGGEILATLIAWGARDAPALSNATRAILEAHDWCPTGRVDHRGAPIYMRPS